MIENKTKKKWEDKQKNRNEAVRQRRIARRQYWKKETDELLEKTREIFFQTFKPFLGSSKGVNGSDINFKVDGKIISNQETVSEILAGHFATIAGLLWDLNSP